MRRLPGSPPVRAMLPWLLAAYAVAVAAGGTWWLPRASWPRRTPRLGIAVWQALTVTVVASATLAALILAIPCLRVVADWTSLRDCVMSVRAQYASPRGAVASTAGGLLAVAVAGRWPGPWVWQSDRPAQPGSS